MFIKPVNKDLCAGVIVLLIFFCPPVLHIAIFIKLAALIIKTVAHLVANYGANSSIVSCIINLWVEEWRLKNSCREVDTVRSWVIISIDSLWCHVPFLLVNRLTPALCNTIFMCCFLHTLYVFEECLCIINNENAINILPLVRISNLDIEGIQFLQRLSFGCRGHPCVLFNALSKSLLQVLYEFNHTMFAALWEVFLYVELTNSLAHDTLYE